MRITKRSAIRLILLAAVFCCVCCSSTADTWHVENEWNYLDTAMDPDNGMLVKSVGKRSAKSIKYTFYEEVADYIRQKQSVAQRKAWRNNRGARIEDIENYISEMFRQRLSGGSCIGCAL